MIIKPSLRSNVFTNAHPLGCKQYVANLMTEAKTFETFKGPKRVLIIGGSSGYGLSSRVALTVAGGASTVNVSYESAPKGERTGSAGWWNNIYFQQLTAGLPSQHKDFIGDAFAKETKDLVTQYIKANWGKVDLVIYSLASGARLNPSTKELVRSAIKPIGKDVVGKTIDVAERKVVDLTIPAATAQEIQDTVYVMGGSDWKDWLVALDQAGVLAPGAKTISYTYIGGPTNAEIYRAGTLGKAKEDLETKAKEMNLWLKSKYQGEALISSSKAVVTKASVFIPKMPIYVACLFETMIKHQVHETTLRHKYRLFKEMVYGNKRNVDTEGRLRLDAPEMEPSIQKETSLLMSKYESEQIFKLKGMQLFIEEFYRIHGFGFPEVDYEKDVPLESLSLLQPK